MPLDYLPRVVDTALSEILSFPGAVLLEGPRACGKTATGKHHAKSTVQLDREPNALSLAAVDPARMLLGSRPRFIDEWQLAPQIWNQTRAAVDDDPDASFILAGSAHPADDITRHSGAGRILRLRMRPLSLFESQHSTGEVSLAALFSPETVVAGESRMTIEDLAEAIVRGGWPGLRKLPLARSAALTTSYLDDVTRVDLPRLEGEPSRSPDGVRRLLTSLGRNTSTEASIAAIARDASSGGAQMTPATARSYLAALERIFVIEDQPSWGPHLRSRDRLRKAAKRHFVDPSLAAAAVGADSNRLLSDLEFFGLLFESLAVRDLRIYSDGLGGAVRHYRDSAGREVDAIIERRDGSWIGCEVKLAASREDEAAASLIRFAENLNTQRTTAPSSLVIITGGKYAYTRPDGIHVVPLAALGP